MGGGGGHAIGGGFGGAGLGPHTGGVVGPHFGGARFVGTGLGPRTGGMVGPHFGGARFFGAHAAFRPQFGFHRPFFHHRFFHHRFHRFAFIGVPYYATYYDDCWRRVWTHMDCSGSTSATTTATKRWRTHIIVMIATGAFSGEEKLDRRVAIVGERP